MFPFLYLMKTSKKKNPLVFWRFQEALKWNFAMKLVNMMKNHVNMKMLIYYAIIALFLRKRKKATETITLPSWQKKLKHNQILCPVFLPKIITIRSCEITIPFNRDIICDAIQV